MELKEYMRELWLMEKQYGQEEELYPLINILLRENINEEGISIRDIHKAQRTGTVNNRKYLNGFASVPDLVILDEKFYANSENEDDLKDWENYLLGCVEAKTEIKLSCDKNSNEKRPIEGIAIDEKDYAIKNPEIKFYHRENTKIRSLCEIVKDQYIIDEISSGEEEYIRITPKTDNNNPNLVRYGALIKKDVFNGIVPIEIKCDGDKISYKAKFVKCDDSLFEGKNDPFSQLFGELLWYGKVLYTDGKSWIFLKLENNSEIRKQFIEEKCENMKQVYQKLDTECINKIKIEYELVADMNGLFDKLKANIAEDFFDTAWKKVSVTEEDKNQWKKLKAGLLQFF